MYEIFDQFDIWALLDVFFISIVLYYLMLLIKGTRTAQMLAGVLLLFFCFLASSVLPLTALNWLIEKFYSSLMVILIILFQDDIRLALSKIGKRSFVANNDVLASTIILDEIARAINALSKRKIGALLVMERQILLNRYVDIGTLIHANLSRELLLAIFHPSSPIHDGAAIIQKGRITACGCFLPLTKEENLKKNWGTRHRAAIGVSEETDAIVIVVSEETGAISFVFEGQVKTVADGEELKKLLSARLSDILALKEAKLKLERQRKANI